MGSDPESQLGDYILPNVPRALLLMMLMTKY